ncbi:hypothetical protein C8J57DRAFT_1259585 [Mycena rebaudengoi]|nr:hypothetical protein C8J57DRAFT_1259585 [Mycena rebaudengoi]
MVGLYDGPSGSKGKLGGPSDSHIYYTIDTTVAPSSPRMTSRRHTCTTRRNSPSRIPPGSAPSMPSGGGFSNRFAMPDYQKDAVTNYLCSNPPPFPANLFNSTGKSRAFPDISVNGANYVVAVHPDFNCWSDQPVLSDEFIKKMYPPLSPKVAHHREHPPLDAAQGGPSKQEDQRCERSRLTGYPKLADANNAGTKYAKDCMLILTEGDSAKTLAIARLSVVGHGRDPGDQENHGAAAQGLHKHGDAALRVAHDYGRSGSGQEGRGAAIIALVLLRQHQQQRVARRLARHTSLHAAQAQLEHVDVESKGGKEAAAPVLAPFTGAGTPALGALRAALLWPGPGHTRGGGSLSLQVAGGVVPRHCRSGSFSAGLHALGAGIGIS